jgi:hypothetical protein
MRGVHLRSIRPDFSTRSVTMDLEMRFRLNNLSSTALTIPDHQATFELAGRPMSGIQPLFPPGTAIPADGSVDLAYLVRIDTGALSPAEQDLLGRDVPYRFSGNFEIPFSNDVPPQVLAALAAVGLDPSFTIALEDTIRVPLLPKAEIAGLPRLDVLGGEITVVSRPLDLGIAAALRPLFEAAVRTSIDAADLADTSHDLTASEKEQRTQDWLGLFDVMVDPSVPLVEMEPVTGMKVSVPIEIQNPNHFEIALPSLAVDFDAGAKNVWTLTQSPSNGTLGRAGTQTDSRGVVYESTFHFDAIGDAAFSSDRKLEVESAVDLGHGRTELPIRLP